MIIKKFIAIGIEYADYVNNVRINNRTNNYYSDTIIMDYQMVSEKTTTNTFYTDYQYFDCKKDAINHIFTKLIHTNSNVINWSIMKIYIDTYDILEIRKHKIKRLIKKIKKSKKINSCSA